MQRPGRAIAALVVAMISVQLGASVAKQLFPVVGPAGTTALRTTMAALILCAIWRPWRGPLPRQSVKAVILYGATLGGMNLLFYQALVRIPLGIAVGIEFLGPLSIAVVASRRALDLVWVALASLGIVLILPLAQTDAALDPVGIAYALAAALFWALYIVFGQRLGSIVHAGRATALGMAVAALVALPFGIAQAGTALLAPAVLPIGLFIAVLSSAVPYSLEMVSMKHLPAKTFGILMSMEPAMAALFGLGVLGERLSPMQWAAIACIIAASGGVSLTGKGGKAG